MDTSLELRLETSKSLGNFQLQLLKSFYNGHSTSENYLNRRNIIHVHGLLSSEGFCATYLRSRPDGTINESECHMLIWIGNRGKSLRPFTSLERLQTLDSCEMSRIKTVETPFSMTAKTLWRVLDKELCVLYNLWHRSGQVHKPSNPGRHANCK